MVLEAVGHIKVVQYIWEKNVSQTSFQSAYLDESETLVFWQWGLDSSGLSLRTKSCLWSQVSRASDTSNDWFAYLKQALKSSQKLWHCCRGVISLEDIPITDSAFGQQAVILMPDALQITAATARQTLGSDLSSSTLQALEVRLANQHLQVYSRLVPFLLHFRDPSSAENAYMQMLLLSSRTMAGLLPPC